jgi:hypothetical protein
LQKIFHYRNDKIEIVEKIMKTIVSLALGLAYPIQESRDKIILGALATNARMYKIKRPHNAENRNELKRLPIFV